MTSNVRLILSSLASAGLVMGACAGRAWGQDALGSGNALDRNPGVGTGGRNTGVPSNPFAGRNAVITGEVVGGREFRGRVGYTAPNDFFGRTPIDSLYRFRADSAWSSPTAWSLGSSTFDQLRFGQSLGTYTLALQRPSQGATPMSVAELPTPGGFVQNAQSRWQINNMAVTALSQEQQQRRVEPTTLRTVMTDQGLPVAITASSVRGLVVDPHDYLNTLGLSTYDEVRAREEMIDDYRARRLRPPSAPGEAVTPLGQEDTVDDALRIGTAFQTRFDNVQIDARSPDDTAVDSRVDGAPESGYGLILQRIADRYVRSQDDRTATLQPALLDQLDREYEDLRGSLSGRRPRVDPATGKPVPSNQSGAPTSSLEPGTTGTALEPGATGRPTMFDPRDPRNQRPGEPGAMGATGATGATGEPGMTGATGSTGPRPARDPLTNAPQPPNSQTPDPTKPLDLSKLAPALKHGQRIEKLTSEQQGRFNELMMSAEDQLRKGEYMNAEQRFQRALRFTPGHPLAMAGVANAQRGAELYLAAADTLRVLFADHPEMIDVTWAEGLLPPREHLDAAVKALRLRLETPNDRASNAMLLAYLGRQMSDSALIAEGLAVLAAESADDPLVPLLRAVWLDGGSAPAPLPPPEK